jgi:hypothetical protein
MPGVPSSDAGAVEGAEHIADDLLHQGDGLESLLASPGRKDTRVVHGLVTDDLERLQDVATRVVEHAPGMQDIDGVTPIREVRSVANTPGRGRVHVVVWTQGQDKLVDDSFTERCSANECWVVGA